MYKVDEIEGLTGKLNPMYNWDTGKGTLLLLLKFGLMDVSPADFYYKEITDTINFLEKHLETFSVKIDPESELRAFFPLEPDLQNNGLRYSYKATFKGTKEQKKKADIYLKSEPVGIAIHYMLGDEGNFKNPLARDLILAFVDGAEKIKEQRAEIEKLKAVNSRKKNLDLSIHSVKQLFGDNKQLQLFSDKIVDEFISHTGQTKLHKPDSYGVVLNQAQERVYMGIIKAFSDTNYLGDQVIDKNEEFKNRGINIGNFKATNKVKQAYSNIEKIPEIKLTQAQIIDLSGYDLQKQRQGDKTDVTEAISFLGSKQFCFYWLRLIKDEKGVPVKDKKGDYVKEECMEVGTLFRITYVKEEGSNDLKHYEISPTAVILDQVNNNYGGTYFLSIPEDWRDEVKQITGKRASSYTYNFLLWLRLQYEQIRQHNAKPKVKKKAFKLSRSWEEIAIVLKMPESMYKANRKRASKIILDAQDIAIKLGYLQKVINNGAIDELFLNEEYYPKPGELV